MKTLRVELGDRSYPVLVGANILSGAGRVLLRLGFDTPPVVVTNPRVLRLHGNALLSSLEGAFGPVPVIRIGDGERFKNHDTLAKIYEGLFRARADRRSWVVAFGGGVVGDVAGFAAATFMRGIPYVGVPTTLLAQVDSSVGGKVGINVARGKNLIGAFHQPSAVLSDIAVLRTLPARELAAGLYEIVKCGAIRSEPLLGYLEKKLSALLACEPSSLARAVMGAVRIKAEVVAGDEREAHTRMILNFGHTLGHALEAATAYRRFKHGEAVAWGMIATAELSAATGGFRAEEAQRLIRLIRRIERLPSLQGISAQRVWAALQRDKKSRGGKIRMILLPQLGRSAVVDNLDPACIRRFITDFLTHRRDF
ncbi:MAG: 3-dehydroquinate synthase [Acidobacteriia bacterium]|nr:3-dehydroquinate synthase [Terriglobia bacterium]